MIKFLGILLGLFLYFQSTSAWGHQWGLQKETSQPQLQWTELESDEPELQNGCFEHSFESLRGVDTIRIKMSHTCEHFSDYEVHLNEKELTSKTPHSIWYHPESRYVDILLLGSQRYLKKIEVCAPIDTVASCDLQVYYAKVKIIDRIPKF